MNKVTKRGGVTITDDEKGTRSAVIEFFALSLAATRREGEDLRVDHTATSSNATTEAEALKEGLEKAKRKWPASEGWDIDVQTEAVRLTIQFR